MAVKSFTIYDEYYELIKNLKKSEKQELLLAIFEYMFEDKEPQLKGMTNAIFINLKRPLNVSKSNSKRAKKIKPNENQMKTELKPNENQNDNQTKTHQDVDVNVYVNNKIISFIENNFNRTISSYEYETLSTLQDKYGEDLLLYALKKTLEANKTTMNYYKGILKNLEQDGIKTLSDIKEKNKTKKSVVPEWYGKEIQSQESKEETEEFKKFINEIRGN